MFNAMRNAFIAVAFIAATANAQYKTPPTPPPTQPGAVQVAPNNNIQVTTATNPDDELSKARRINRDEAIELVKQHKAVWVDVRGKDAFDQSHIPGAISIPLTELNEHLTKLPPHKLLITYCA
jgi:rhodanese-like protein